MSLSVNSGRPQRTVTICNREVYRVYINGIMCYGKGWIASFDYNDPFPYYDIGYISDANLDRSDLFYYYYKEGLFGGNGDLNVGYSNIWAPFAYWLYFGGNNYEGTPALFTGWYSAASGGVQYFDSNGVATTGWNNYINNENSYLSGRPPSITLYAQWKITMGRLTLNLNNPKSGNSNFSPGSLSRNSYYYCYQTTALKVGDANTYYTSVAVPSGSYGMTFTGWYTSSGTQMFDSNGNPTNNWTNYVNNINNFPGGEQALALYAHWDIWTYTIQFAMTQHNTNLSFSLPNTITVEHGTSYSNALSNKTGSYWIDYNNRTLTVEWQYKDGNTYTYYLNYPWGTRTVDFLGWYETNGRTYYPNNDLRNSSSPILENKTVYARVKFVWETFLIKYREDLQEYYLADYEWNQYLPWPETSSASVYLSGNNIDHTFNLDTSGNNFDSAAITYSWYLKYQDHY